MLLAKARDLKIDVPESEPDTAHAEARKNIPEEAFQQELAKRYLTAADMREGLRRDNLRLSPGLPSRPPSPCGLRRDR